MSECYLCGAYVKRGEGFRRHVETGTSTRIYIGSRQGASFGAAQGLRTVCKKCASTIDRSADGRGMRMLGYGFAWIALAYAGFSISDIGSGSTTIFGLAFLIGPPIVFSWMERARERRIAGEELERSEFATDVLKAGESVSDWIARVAPMSRENPELWDRYARFSPPLVGQSVQDWARSWIEIEELERRADEFSKFRADETPSQWLNRIEFLAATLSEASKENRTRSLEICPPVVGETGEAWWNRMRALHLEQEALAETPSPKRFSDNHRSTVFQEGDTLSQWANRFAPALSVSMGKPEDDTLDMLYSMARFVKPKPGESLRAWQIRYDRRMANLNFDLDLHSPESGIRNTESTADWLDRVAPLFVLVDDGESIDDVIPQLARIADTPEGRPNKEESAKAWLARVNPLISAANAGGGIESAVKP